MMRYRTAALALFAAALAAAATTVYASQGLRPGAVPAPSQTDLGIRFYEQRAQRDPLDSFSRSQLAALYVQKARECGDLAYYRRAEEAAKSSLKVEPRDNYPAVATLAWVQLSEHQFQAAIQTAQEARRLKPDSGYSYGIEGECFQELGNYAEAGRQYRVMLERQPGISAYCRMSRLAFLQGQPSEAERWIQQAIDAATGHAVSAETLAWCQYQLGTLRFQRGDLAGSEAAFRASLHTFPGYFRALGGLGRTLAAQGRTPAAIEALKQSIDAVPYPDIVALLGDLYARSGQRSFANQQYALVEFTARVNPLLNRLLALYYLDHDRHLTEALKLAQGEWAGRKDIYGADALVWALYKNRRYLQAAALLPNILRLGTQDAQLLFHAGMIQSRVGAAKEARRLLRQALAINPHFHLTYPQVARATLASLERTNP